jgi:transposase
MPGFQNIINLPGFNILNISHGEFLEFELHFERSKQCIYCNSENLRIKDTFIRRVRHVSFGERLTRLHIKAHKFKCEDCGKYFNQRFPGIQYRKRATEKFRKEVFVKHFDGVTQKTLAKRVRIGQATVERWAQDFLKLEESKQDRSRWPRVLGIDEHFFTRKKGYATTFADLTKHKTYDVTLGRSEKALAPYLRRNLGRERVQVVLMDLSDTYRSIAKKYFSNALIVADRFHVVRLINHHFMEVWKQLDPERRKNRGLISLMRRHHKNLKTEQKIKLRKYLCEVPGLEAVYDFKQNLNRLMCAKHKTRKQCKSLIRVFLRKIEMLKESKFDQLRVLGATLDKWKNEIARMWRFTKTNSITEGLHNKMERISRNACGFRNFENYRIRVRYLCGY